MLACLLALVGALASAQTKWDLPESPQNRWVFETIAELQRDGVLVSYPNSHRPNPRSRYELAVAAYAAWSNLKSIIDVGRKEDRPLAAEHVKNLSKYRKQLLRLTDYFAVELRELGVDVNLMRSEIPRYLVTGGTETPFLDVPKNHWASKAVGDLRKKGILAGYPDGTFRG